MNLQDYKKVNLLDLVEIERAKKGKIYQVGNIIIQVSASRGQIIYLDKKQEVEPQYIVLKVNEVNSKYLYYLLEEELPRFLKKYQTGINIQPDVFKHLNISIHTDIQTQNYIANLMDKLEEDIKKEVLLLEEYKNFKKYHLDNMFV